jgi:hypothetical protein
MSAPRSATSTGGSRGGAGQILRDARPFEGVGRMGFGIVMFLSLVLALNETLPALFGRPFAKSLPWFFSLFVTNLITGVGILAAAVWARYRYPAPGRAQHVRAFFAVALATVLVTVLTTFVLWVLTTEGPMFGPKWKLDEFFIGVGTTTLQFAIYGLVITAAWLYTRTESEHDAAIAQCAVDSVRMDEQTAEARLQMLEAQIEPHFLFNTLAHVKRLYETDRGDGARMLDNLKAYLAVALPQMRAADSTLGRELDHARAYLQIQQIRMGHRLAFASTSPSRCARRACRR